MKTFMYGLHCLLVLFSIASPSAYSQTAVTLNELKEQIILLQEKITLIEKSQKEQVKSTSDKTSTLKESTSKRKNDLRVYATLRPTFGYIKEDNENLWDIRDALSHAGFKATTYFDDDWSAVLHGEWGIDLSNNGDFGSSRQVYVALNSPLGTIGIGKQRQPQYLFIAEHVDIFNHSNSPFAYDPESIFFVDNLLTYNFKSGNLTWLLALQFDGKKGSNNSDLTNIGISYDNNGLHAAFTYLTQNSNSGDVKSGEDEVFASSVAYQFTNSLYLALSYQSRHYQNYSEPKERDGNTFDAAASYQLAENYKLKLGLFDFSDGYDKASSRNFKGYNSTLEWIPSASLRFHLEYLHRNYKYLPDFSSISIGFRYDFSVETKY